MDKVTYISFDWLEDRYVSDLGDCYKTIEDIPPKYRHLVKDKQKNTTPLSVIKKFKKP